MKTIALSAIALMLSLNAKEKNKPAPTPPPALKTEVGSPVLELKNSWHLSTQVDYLYWSGSEVALPYALKAKTTLQIPSNPTGPFSLEPVKEYYVDGDSWSSGVRVGLGFDFPYDGWAFNAQYTHYSNQQKNSTHVPEFAQLLTGPGIDVLVDPWSNPADNIITATRVSYYQSIRAHWELTLNLIDLTLSRPFWISKSLSLSPFAGVRLAWNDTDFKTVSTILEGSTAINNHKKFKNHYFGAGLVAGVAPTFYFNRHFFLFNTIDFSLLYGNQKNSRKAEVETPTSVFDILSKSNSSTNNLQPIFDLNIGLGWGNTTANNRAYYEFKVGYEAHAWFNSTNRLKLLTRNFDGNTEPSFSPFDDFLNVNNNQFFQGVFGSFDIHY